ncbi:MAG: hypothetical protein QOH49_50 [Acidobacteriota bacterium]|jgi:hypothetical protein|nr:hypothetical protein [Acidobacteriota bacterium]
MYFNPWREKKCRNFTTHPRDEREMFSAGAGGSAGLDTCTGYNY